MTNTNALRTATVSNEMIKCTLKEQADGNLQMHFDHIDMDATKNLFIMTERNKDNETKIKFGDDERNAFNMVDLSDNKEVIHLTVELGSDTVFVEGGMQQKAFDLVLKELNGIKQTVKDQLEIEQAQLIAQDEIMTQMFAEDNTEEDEYREQDGDLPDGLGMYEIGHGGLDW